MGILKKALTACLVAFAVMLVTSSIALAFLASPTSMSIVSAKAFRNLAQPGDMLVVFHYKIGYSSYPTTPAGDSVIFRLYDTDGTTLLAQASPYNFNSFATHGYGDGVSSFYFDPATAPVWGAGYFINLLATPAYYNPSNFITYQLTSSDYSSAITQTDAQYDLYNTVVGLALAFHDIYPAVPLLADTGSTQVLSVYGEPYFRATIPGLQTLSPQCFYLQQTTPTQIPVVPYTMNTTMTQNILAGSDLQRGADRIGVTMGVSGMAVWGGLYFVALLVICVATYRKGWGVEPALAIGSLLGILAASVVRDFFFTITMIAGLIGGIAISYVVLFRRA